MLKITATLLAAVSVWFISYPLEFAFLGTSNGALRQTLVKADSGSDCFWILRQSKDAKAPQLNKLTQAISRRVSLPKYSVATSQFRFYSLVNDLHYNRPLTTYKFPLSEHTEEG